MTQTTSETDMQTMIDPDEVLTALLCRLDHQHTIEHASALGWSLIEHPLHDEVAEHCWYFFDKHGSSIGRWVHRGRPWPWDWSDRFLPPLSEAGRALAIRLSADRRKIARIDLDALLWHCHAIALRRADRTADLMLAGKADDHLRIDDRISTLAMLPA